MSKLILEGKVVSFKMGSKGTRRRIILEDLRYPEDIDEKIKENEIDLHKLLRNQEVQIYMKSGFAKKLSLIQALREAKKKLQDNKR